MTQWGLDTLFNPAKRHMDEEKRRLQSTREEIGDNSGGKRIDLESGKVVISRTGEDDDTPDPSTAEPGQPTADGTGRRSAKPGLSPAAERAAKRRARRTP